MTWSGLRCPECSGDPFPGCPVCAGTLCEFKKEGEAMANGMTVGNNGSEPGSLSDTIGMPLIVWGDEETVRRAGARGGAYLESIGKYDLASLSKEEWNYFILCVLTGSIERVEARFLSCLEQNIPG
ncbi:MAG: hypothetical protein E6Q97_27740 [Desulfurellales bacterium]|nr:MAG: hypothetical protein E6Q97_27740 [Desulfurellales bacterium]